MQRKPSQNLLPVYFALVLMLGLFLGYNMNNSKTGSSFFSRGGNNSLQEIFNLINSKYVDEVNVDSITSVTAEDLLSKLDPHSAYIPPQNVEIANNELEGKFTGIGVLYHKIDDTLYVTQLIDNGPAKLAGIEIGDKIISINDSIKLTLKNIDEDFVRSKMRGEEGTIVYLNILRDNQNKKIAIKRASLNISSIDAAYMMNNKTGYIKINRFADRTYEEFMVELEKLVKANMESLVVDLRGNGGGFMHAATAIADEFLDGDKLIVYTQGIHSIKEEKRCNKDGMFEKGKLVILVDEFSASASEVLAGALQDWDRATIIGRRSFGKGLVQQQYKLSNGGALRLTTARYFSPLGRNIQKPYNKGKEEYDNELSKRYEDGEVIIGDTATKKDKAYKTPQGKIVYGGGGITPNYFIGFDTSNNKFTSYKLLNSNAGEKFLINYFLKNKKQLNSLKNTNELDKQISMNDNDWNELLLYSKKDSTKPFTLNDSAKQFLSQKMKAKFAKQLFNNQAFYQISNQSDEMIIKALEVLQ